VVTRASQKCFSFSTKTAIIQIDNFLVPPFLIPDFATLSKKNILIRIAGKDFNCILFFFFRALVV